MTDLTELEQNADRAARHGHRELVEKLGAELDGATRIIEMQDNTLNQLRARVAELEAQNRWLLNDAETVQHALDAEWNAAIRAAFGHAEHATNLPEAADRILTLLREGGSDE